jgi:flagellar hook-length control protein FliK
MFSGQVATAPNALANAVASKKGVGETALLDLFSGGFGQVGAAGFSGHLTQVLAGETKASDRPEVIVSSKSAPLARKSEPSDSADADRRSPSARVSGDVRRGNSSDSVDSYVEEDASPSGVPTLGDAVKELETAARALDEALQDPSTNNEELAALVVGFVVALQQVQTAVAAFQGEALPSQSNIEAVVLVAENALARLQEFVQASQTGVVNSGEAQDSFSQALQALLGEDAALPEVDVQNALKQLTAQMSAVKQAIAQVRMSQSLAAVVSAPVAANAAQGDVNTSSAQGQAQAQPVVDTTSSAASGRQEGVTAVVKNEAAAPVAPLSTAAAKVDAPVAAPVVGVAVNAGGSSGQAASGGGQQFTQQNPAAQILPSAASGVSSSSVSESSFEKHVHTLSGAKIIEQIQLQMKSAVKDGVSRIVVKLNPVELGEVEIKMEIGATGKTGVVISVDRPQTLALLQQDVKQLQQMLNDLGLKADANSLSFNLRGGDQQQSNQQNYKPSKYPALSDDFEEEIAAIVPVKTTLALRSGVNIKV